MKIQHLALAILATSVSSATYAQDGSNNSLNVPNITFDPIVITATRTPNKTTDIIAQTTVINSSELKKYKGQTVLEVLKNQAAFDFTQNGGFGTTSNFYLRGYDNKSILVLIDGIKYKAEAIGQPALHLIATDTIDRIEILHGASGSSIYGSDAVGGVIQIFTKGTLGKNTAMNAHLGYGSNNHKNIGASAQYATDTSSIAFGMSHSETSGFSAKKIDGDDNNDTDGFEINAANLSIHSAFTDSLNAGMSVLYNQSETEIDGWSPHVTATQDNAAANLFIEHTTDNATTRLSYGVSIDTLHDTSSYEMNNSQKHARLSSRITANDNNIFTIGLENLRQKVSPNEHFTVDNRDINSAFIGYQFTHALFDLQANYRLDDNSQYGKQDTYHLGASFSPTQSIRLGSAYSTGFRSPTFFDLYSAYAPSPNLKPETSENTEAFVEFHNKQQYTRLTAYLNEVTNKIALDNNNGWKAYNNDKARIAGFNISSNWQLNNVLLGVGYDYQDSDIISVKNKGNALKYQPENKAFAYVGYVGDDYDFRIKHQYVGSRFTNDENNDKLSSYYVLNASANYYVTPELTATLTVNNVADTQYETISGYNTQDRNYFVSLAYDF